MSDEMPDTTRPRPPPAEPLPLRRGIQSVAVGVDVLAALARGGGPMTLGELSARTGMPASKVHRYLASFLAKGLVVQNGRSGTYDLGPLAVEIGLAALGRSNLVNAAAERLPDLAHRTSATALLSVWGPDGATIVRIERSELLVVTALSLGTRLPLLSSATGHVFLAYLPPGEVESQLRRELAAHRRAGRAHATDPGAIRSAVRAAGFASVDGQFIPGLAAAAAPALDGQGRPEAVVTLISTDGAITDPDGPAVAALRASVAAVGHARPQAD